MNTNGDFTPEQIREIINTLRDDVLISIYNLQFEYPTVKSTGGYDCDFEGLIRDFAQSLVNFADNPEAVKAFEKRFYNSNR